MDDRKTDLFADFGLAGADRFNILLIKHDMIGPGRQVKDALPGRGHAMEDTQKEPPVLTRPQGQRWLVWRLILYQNRHVANATAKFLRERVERLFDHPDEMLTLHPSPTEIKRARSLRVAVALVVIIVIFCAVVFLFFLFFLFLVWLLSKEGIGS
jgi:hypothetical protein